MAKQNGAKNQARSSDGRFASKPKQGLKAPKVSVDKKPKTSGKVSTTTPVVAIGEVANSFHTTLSGKNKEKVRHNACSRALDDAISATSGDPVAKQKIENMIMRPIDWSR